MSPEIAVLYAPSALQTPRFVAEEEVLDVYGQPVEEARPPDRKLLEGHGPGIALLWDQGKALTFVEAAVRLTTARYELENWTFTPVTTSIRLDAGALVWFVGGDWRTPPRVDGYGIAGGGMQASVLGAEPFVTAFAPAAHGLLGLGVANRVGKVRVRTEVRSDVALRVDHLAGRAEGPVGAFTWSWFPGEAGISVVLGVGSLR